MSVLFASIVAAVAVFGTIFVSQPAYALCLSPKEEGDWKNVDPNTRGIVAIRVRFVCQDTPVDGQPCCPPGPPYYMRLWGACAPTACDWGQVGANRNGAGDIYGFYNHGYATHEVWVAMSANQPGKLWVTVRTNFVDPNRPDTVMDQFFVRQ